MKNNLGNPVRAVIFDMDGVIVNSQSVWNHLELTFLKQLVGRWTLKDQVKIVGRSVYDTYNILTKNYSLKLGKREYLERYNGLAKQVYQEKVRLISDIEPLLKDKRIQKKKVALASSSPHGWINMVMRRFKLRRFFDVIVSSEDINGESKPAPDIYLHTAKKLNIKPEFCLVIEDSVNGVKAAERAGMHCVWLNEAQQKKGTARRTTIISSHKQILSQLNKLLD